MSHSALLPTLLLCCSLPEHARPLKRLLEQSAPCHVLVWKGTPDISNVHDEWWEKLADCDLAVFDMATAEVERWVARLQSYGRGCKTLALTAFGDADGVKRCIDAGLDDVLPKPVACTRLMLSMRSLLKARALEREIAVLTGAAGHADGVDGAKAPARTTQPAL